jgi:hypothetical protein
MQHYLTQNAHLGRLLRNNVEKGDYLLVDPNRLLKASAILSNDKFDHGAVFLFALLADYPGYGNVLQIEFVDECSDIVQIDYVGPDVNAASAICLLKVPSGEFHEIRYYGTFRKEIILRAEGETITKEPKGEFPLKPHYIFLPRSTYENIIAAKGELLLIDCNGKILDILPLRRRPMRQE